MTIGYSDSYSGCHCNRRALHHSEETHLHDDPLGPERASSSDAALERVLAEDVAAVRVGVAPPEARHHRAPRVRQRVGRLQPIGKNSLLCG